jgi:hypothetical protein
MASLDAAGLILCVNALSPYLIGGVTLLLCAYSLYAWTCDAASEPPEGSEWTDLPISPSHNAQLVSWERIL